MPWNGQGCLGSRQVPLAASGNEGSGINDLIRESFNLQATKEAAQAIRGTGGRI